MKPFFSIIIPTLNEEKYLPLLLEDLSRQSYNNFELFIVDGNSQDDTVKRAQEMSNLFKHFNMINCPRRHVCTQRNLGAQKAKSDYLIFMDADNRIPAYFLQGIKYRLESEQSDLATCWINSDRDTPAEKTIAIGVNYALELSKNSKYFVFPESMTIITKQAFTLAGGFNEKVNYAESRQLIESALKNGDKISLFHDPTYSFSLRRLRKFGVLQLASRMVRAHIKTLFGENISNQEISKLYPMKGGKFFDQPIKNKQNYVKEIIELFNFKRFS